MADKSGDMPSGDDIQLLKGKLRELMNSREQMETEISARSERLNAPGMPGLKGPLVDEEGYPFPDVDIFQVRADRNRLAVLHTDHKTLTGRVEEMLHELHRLAKEAKPSHCGSSAPQAPPTAQDPSQTVGGPARPFALVDQVSEGSPAYEAGIQLGDHLCQFGEVIQSAGGNELQRIGAMMQAAEGNEIKTVVQRNGALVQLVLVPKTWDGRGLLGCHLSPLS